MARVVLGIDPGTATTGYGLVQEAGNRLQAVAYGVVRTKADKPLPERLAVVHRELTEIIAYHRPDRMAVEELFFNRNVRSALAVGQARGVALLAAAMTGLAVHEYPPTKVKMAVVGYGRASKEQVQEMVRLLLGLPEVPRPDDAADALAIALCCLHSRGLEMRLAHEGERK
ncbi:MAG TPA: crossover junction endodeoxyribonuclease RuvC [Firmicutes bacterium]|jgi:crossover junction endodeoxyribonuclease RuvC|nr:crossover junction endodeoxyribonuclease RuvC [Bacillota bacterium]